MTGWDEHETILHAIEHGDVETARRATFEHMSSVMRDLALSAPGNPRESGPASPR